MQPTNKLRWAKRGPIEGTSFLVLQQWWQEPPYVIDQETSLGEWRDIEVVEE